MMSRRGLNIVLSVFAVSMFVIALAGCIHNDIPYPRIPQKILQIEAAGEQKSAYIDSLGFEVTIYLPETVDIQNVTFPIYRITPGATSIPDLSDGYYDLSTPLYVTLQSHYDYGWEIRAVQNIVRYFNIEGQIGESIVDVAAHRVVVTMPEGTDLSHLVLQSAKLGPEGITTVTPALNPGEIDLSYPLRVSVECFGRSTYWTIYVELSELIVNTSQVDPWSEVIWAYGDGPADVKNGFQYRESSSSAWIDVPASYVTQTQGAFSCYIPHLKPLTEYVVRTVSGSDFGNEVKVTTQPTRDLPNADFENWCQIGKIIYPFAENGIRFWDTGNTGSATLGQNLSVSSDHTPTGTGKSAELNTKFVGIAGIGKLGAGSIFTGSFRKVDGTNGILDFGQPWTERPTKLRGYFQYRTKDIDYASSEFAYMKGRPDTCIIYVALTDWTAPYEIRTNPKNRNLFDSNASYVIGYGQMQYSGTMDSFEEFEIDIKYRDTSRIPTYIQITCATSKYGDYFTGGNGAVMWVDQFSLGWDIDTNKR